MKSVKGSIWITKDGINKRIDPSQLSCYLSEGWAQNFNSTSTADYIFINNGLKNKSVRKSDLNSYLSSGWVEGYITINKIKKCRINNSIEEKLIPEDDLDLYLSEGWIRGRLKSNNVWVNNDIEEIFIDKDKIPDGYTLGRLKSDNSKITINNGIKSKKIFRKDLNNYLVDGWVEGPLRQSTKNKVWINNGIDTLYLYKDEVDKYLDDGWEYGNLNSLNRIYVTNGKDNHMIKSDELDFYLSKGYYLGSNSKSTLGTRWVQKDNEFYMIKSSELSDYLSKGFILGRPISASKDKSWVNKDGKSTYIDKDEIINYLSSGWSIGKIPYSNNNKITINDGYIEKVVSQEDYILNYKYSDNWELGSLSSLSQPEILFKDKLINNGFREEDIIHNFYLNYKNKRYFYDFKINSYLIEINPSYTHTVSDTSIFCIDDSKYHFNKSEAAKSNGFKCIHVWDWDDLDKIINLLSNRNRIFARKCCIKEVSREEAKCFIDKIHLQGYAKDSIRIGLFYEDKLISIMTFGKPRYNKNYEYELVRYCSSHMVIGGAEKLFKYFIDKYNPRSIISYCDRSKFNGEVYSKLGFKFKSMSLGKHWCDGSRHITDNLLRQQGFDRLFGTNYGKGSDNNQLMLDNGFYEVFDAGQDAYILER